MDYIGYFALKQKNNAAKAALWVFLLVLTSCGSNPKTGYGISSINLRRQTACVVKHRMAGMKTARYDTLRPNGQFDSVVQLTQFHKEGHQAAFTPEEFREQFEEFDVFYTDSAGKTLSLSETGLDLKDIGNWRYNYHYDVWPDEKGHRYSLELTDSLFAR